MIIFQKTIVILILIILTIQYNWPVYLIGIALAYLFISSFWFYSIFKNVQLQTA